jgi:hypothetical protein
MAVVATAASAQQQPVQKVHTALNHLTVIEAAEPITMVAVGSDAFEIERHGNRIFVKPTKTGVSTNLFVWTEHGRSFYELDPAGEVRQMDVLIGPAPQYNVAAGPEEAPADDTDKVAEKVLSETLLSAQPVKTFALKTRKDRVNVELDGVMHDKDAIYIRYKVTNLTSVPYRLGEPTVALVTGSKPPDIAIAVNTQVGESYLSHLGTVKTTAVPVLRSEIAEKDLAPGQTVTGVLAIPGVANHSRLYRFSFGADAKAPVNVHGLL